MGDSKEEKLRKALRKAVKPVNPKVDQGKLQRILRQTRKGGKAGGKG